MRRKPKFEDSYRWLRSQVDHLRLFLASSISTLAIASASFAEAPSSTMRLAAVAPTEPAPTRVFRELSKRTAPGLPQSTVMSMLQDRQGVLWLATLDGLGTFDGVEVQPVPRMANAPTEGAIYSLTENSAGEILAGGSRSIHIFNGESWRQIDAPSMSFSLVEDSDGSLLRLDASANMLRWAKSGTDESTKNSAWQSLGLGDLGAAQDILGTGVVIQQGDDDDLWFAGRQGIALRSGGHFSLLPEAPESISAFLARSDGSLVIGTLEGSLFHLEISAERWQKLEIPGWTGGWIRSLEEDRRGRIWAGGNAGSVAYGYPGEELRFWGIDNGLVRGGVLDILADREGSVWFALNGRGIYQWLGENWSHRNLWGGDRLDPRLQVFGIRSTLDGRGFWAAVFGRGVWKWDGEGLYEIPEDPFEDARVALEPAADVLWIGSRFGAWERRSDASWRQLFALDSGFVWDFERGPDGRWWAATSSSGLFVEIDGQWLPAEQLNQQLPDLSVRDILWRDDELWAGTMGGVVVFRKSEAIELQHADELPPAVNGILALGDHVWLVGAGGVAIWHPDGVRRLATEHGMPGSTVYSIAQDGDGLIWLGGASGVAHQIPGDTDQWRVFRTQDGLIEEECNHQALWPSPDGSVYVGTMASLARFGGPAAPLSQPPLGIQWTSRPRGSLPPEDRSVRLEWRTPWLLPREIEFRVRVPRLDTAWSSARRERFVQLDSLRPGGWRVEVSARFVGEQEWIEPIVAGWSLEHHWWETKSFALVVMLAMLGSLGLLVRWRTRRLRARAEQLERSVEEAVTKLKVLSGLLPICSVCKKVRDDDGYWQQIERYIDQHSEAVFSHSLCPGCVDEHYAEYSKPASLEDAGPEISS